MRIGEIAALVGLTTRAIRHYHHVGLLPEPERRPNGYRAYSVRDAVLLARVRRLTELGLSLDEVRNALADDAGRELTEILEELDADLARQEAEWVEITNTTRDGINLRGWTLRDSDGNRYRFDNVRIASRATIRIHTGNGRDTRTDLFQDRRDYVWDNRADAATLRDDRGRTVDTESWGRHHH
ncbi:Mercuric resistance operon regulatory protein (plasmid) [Streptomyces sp. ADI95-16]|nr:Mercuric resistance operon regulatory protein [Streptomyces sp. ADI95-16]